MATRQGTDTRDRKKVSGLGVVAGALGAVAMAGIIGLVIVYGGFYNVAATEEHASFTRWAFETTFHNSVESRADGIVAPASFSAKRLAQGATAYKSMCQHCHAGPGVERAEWARGMRPRPPYLTEAAAEWEAQEVFWIVRHGVKMSGMPAFGPSHGDQAIWNIAAFVKQLPAMTPEEYAALGGSGNEAHGGGGHHGGAAQPPGSQGGEPRTPVAPGSGPQGPVPAPQ